MLRHTCILVVKVFAALELVEAWLGILALLDLQVAVVGHAGAGRDQATQDDILLEPAQVVHAAFKRGLGEDAGGLLEAGGRDEALRRQGCLGDAEQQGLAGGGLAAILERLLVDLLEPVLVDLLLDDERGVAHVGDQDPAHHLADDDLDVLVVDEHTLGPVDLLDLVDKEGLQGTVALDLEQIVGADGALSELLAGADLVAVLDLDVLAAGDQVFALLTRLSLDRDLLAAADAVAILHDAGDLADDGGILGLAAFEQLGDARQAARDVAGGITPSLLLSILMYPLTLPPYQSAPS